MILVLFLWITVLSIVYSFTITNLSIKELKKAIDVRFLVFMILVLKIMILLMTCNTIESYKNVQENYQQAKAEIMLYEPVNNYQKLDLALSGNSNDISDMFNPDFKYNNYLLYQTLDENFEVLYAENDNEEQGCEEEENCFIFLSPDYLEFEMIYKEDGTQLMKDDLIDGENEIIIPSSKINDGNMDDYISGINE